jgi:hypothetical protein
MRVASSSAQQQCVAAGGRHLEGPLGALLAPDVREVRRREAGPAIRNRRRADGEQGAPPQVAQHRREIGSRENADPWREGRLGSIGRRQQQIFAAGVAGGERQREGPRHGAQPAVQGQLAHQGLPLEDPGLDGALGSEDAHRNGEIEPRAALAQPGGGQVDRHPPLRESLATGSDCGTHAGHALAHGGLGESDEVDAREEGADPHLHLDGDSIDAVERGADHAGHRVLQGPCGAGVEGRVERTRPCLPPSKGPARAGEAFQPITWPIRDESGARIGR